MRVKRLSGNCVRCSEDVLMRRKRAKDSIETDSDGKSAHEERAIENTQGFGRFASGDSFPRPAVLVKRSRCPIVCSLESLVRNVVWLLDGSVRVVETPSLPHSQKIVIFNFPHLEDKVVSAS